jgi:hypothetical protein
MRIAGQCQVRLRQLLMVVKYNSNLYPSVGVPASSLDGLMALLTEGYKGDALADTQALYDEA